MLQLTSRRFLRELDEAPGENNLQYILKCPCIPFFGNQGLHNEIMLGGNGGRSGVMCERFPYNDLGFNLCVAPQSPVMKLVAYFRVVEVVKTEVLSGQVEESESMRYD